MTHRLNLSEDSGRISSNFRVYLVMHEWPGSAGRHLACVLCWEYIQPKELRVKLQSEISTKYLVILLELALLW